MSKGKLIIFDYDAIIYSVGFATEKRQVEVTHKKSGRKTKFKNQTEFFGNRKHEIGGWLGELNLERKSEGKPLFTKDDFTIETVREPSPLDHTLSTVKRNIQNMCDALEIKDYMGYIGKGNSFRVDRSTLLEYKGGPRKDALRPIQKDDITEYIVSYHNAIVVEGLEADDWCVIKGVENPDGVVVAVDKDAAGFPVNVYNPNNPQWGIRNCDCFGELDLISKTNSKGQTTKDVKGYGRKFFYYQLLAGDSVDNYKPNCFSDINFGDISAYEALEHCKTDEEAFRAIKEVYQYMYPIPREIVGWRGDTFVIDWKYVLSEMWDMARMKRHVNDNVTAESVFTKYGLWS